FPLSEIFKMATARRQLKKKRMDDKTEKNAYDFTPEDEKKELSGSDDDVREDETPIVDKLTKKRPASNFDEEATACADINKVMHAKKKRLECLTKNYMKGSQHKLEQLWTSYHGQRKKTTQQYQQQVSCALQQWEVEAQRAEEQEEKLNNLFRQQLKILQQARAVQNQKLKAVRELYEQFLQNMEEVEKSHEMFLQGTQQELRKEMASLQKKILMDTVSSARLGFKPFWFLKCCNMQNYV
uniref:Synaptonemal complex protein 3 n=1 Tax=Cyprinodon variegatus TaxID=28743 RepID=A0A3Q2E454_CYPVA